MRTIRLALATVLAVVLAVAGPALVLAERPVAELPAKLTDQEFWALTDSLSEANGYFQSDNLVSNERVFARAIPDLVALTKPGGVYLGVGPEQNFTYIAAMKPRMAFITDIRRGNWHLQLLYKALFELSTDRADFVSRLFTKPRPAGLNANSTAEMLMAAYWDAFSSDEKTFTINVKAAQDVLTVRHKMPLSTEDLDGIASVYRAFYWYGPAITWSAKTDLSSPVSSAVNSVIQSSGLNYRGLMTQTDTTGVEYSYMGSEARFNVVKDLESRNLIVPVVGNFAGSKALRGVGAYVRDHGAIVSAFYLSNVEGYLRRDGIWAAFCNNVATFPLDETSLFIRPSGNGLPLALRGVPVPMPAPTTIPIGGTGGGNVPIRFISVSGTNSARSALEPIAAEVKSCSSPG